MNINEIKKKYNTNDSLGKFQFIIRNGMKDVDYKWFDKFDKNDMVRWANSTGKQWTTGSIRDVGNNYKTIEKIKNNGKLGTSTSTAVGEKKQPSKNNDTFSYTMEVKGTDGFTRKIKLETNKSVKDMNATELRSLLEKNYNGKWSYAMFISKGGFNIRTIENSKEKPMNRTHTVIGSSISV